MEESQNLMWLKRKQILKSNIQVPFGVCYNNNSNNSWEERAFAEDAARILGGCIWPPRSYSCNFCKREFRSAQALGGHMNVHRRDRARLKQSLGQLNHEALHFHHKNDFTSSRISPSWPSTISTKENSFHSSSFSWGNHKECPNSEPEGVTANAREQFFKGYGCNDYVETSLSVGQNLVFGQKLSTGDDSDTSYKRPKTSSICSSDDRLRSFQSAEFVLGLKPGMEDLDLELRLGKHRKFSI